MAKVRVTQTASAARSQARSEGNADGPRSEEDPRRPVSWRTRPSIRGMIRKVAHLIKVEELS